MKNFISLLCLLLVFISCKDEAVDDNNKVDIVKVDNEKSSNKLKIDLEDTSIGLGEKIVLKAILNGENVTETVDFYLNEEKLSKKELFFTEEGEHNLIAKKANVEDSETIKITVNKSSLTLVLEKSIIKIGEELILKAILRDYLFKKDKDVTNETEFYVDGKKISGNKVSFSERGSHEIIAKREKYSYDSQRRYLGVTNNLISYKGKEAGFHYLIFKFENMFNFDSSQGGIGTYFEFYTKGNLKSARLNVILGKHKLDRLSESNNFEIFGKRITNDDINFEESFIEVLEHNSNKFNRSKIHIKLKDGSVIKVSFEDMPSYTL